MDRAAVDMSKFNKETEKSVRVVLPLGLYEQVKTRCIDYGDISRVIRHLLRKWVTEGGTVRAAYDEPTAKKEIDDLRARVKALEHQLEVAMRELERQVR